VQLSAFSGQLYESEQSVVLMADCGTLTIIRDVSGIAANNINLERNFMVSFASFAAPPHPGRMVLMGMGPQGLDPGGAA